MHRVAILQRSPDIILTALTPLEAGQIVIVALDDTSYTTHLRDRFDFGHKYALCDAVEARTY